MREWPESRSAAVRAVLLRFYPHQYAWGESCAVTVSLLLTAATPDRDGPVRKPIRKAERLEEGGETPPIERPLWRRRDGESTGTYEGG